MGRHQPLKKWRDRFIQTMKSTGNITIAAREAGVKRPTAYYWKDRNEKFSKEWDGAMDHAVDLLEAEARRRGMVGVDEPVFQGGKQVGVKRRYSDGLLSMLLKANRPEKFGDRQKLEHSGPEGGPVPVIFIPDNGRSDGD